MPINASRIKAIWPLLVETKYTWLPALVVCLALFISLRPGTTESLIRLTGLVLQLLGIGTVIWGISETRALFGYPSFTSKTKGCLGSFPLFRRNVVVAVSGETLSVIGGKAMVYGTHGSGANSTNETRLDALEKNISSIHERINKAQKETDEEFQSITNTLKCEAQSRQADVSAIQKKLETTGTGGIYISAIGATFLFVGVILSTASVEIAGFLK